MMNRMDSLAIARTLRDAGFDQAQSETLATCMVEQDREHLATRADMADLRAEMVELRTDMEKGFAEQEARTKKGFAEVHARFAEQEARMEKGFARVDARFAEQEARMDTRFAEQEARMEKGFAQLETRIERRMTYQIWLIIGGLIAVPVFMKFLGFAA